MKTQMANKYKKSYLTFVVIKKKSNHEIFCFTYHFELANNLNTLVLGIYGNGQPSTLIMEM